MRNLRLEEGCLVRIDKVLAADAAEPKDQLPLPAVEVTMAPFEDTVPAWMGASSRAATLEAYLARLSAAAGPGGAPLKVHEGAPSHPHLQLCSWPWGHIWPSIFDG
jgi:hypothetical protein